MALASQARQASSSALGSFAAFCSYLGVCHFADALMPASQANALGLAAAASVNFMMQRRSFAPGAVLNSSLMKRYVLAEALIVSIQQVFFSNPSRSEAIPGTSRPCISGRSLAAWWTANGKSGHGLRCSVLSASKVLGFRSL
mmetsp:Transcript_70462/g.111351  ORF Transcript_70462/g.111351 Transcript_70462/m.111351 type:complete len:142 (+) Transcript_70462:43-468(+)